MIGDSIARVLHVAKLELGNRRSGGQHSIALTAFYFSSLGLLNVTLGALSGPSCSSAPSAPRFALLSFSTESL